MPRSGTATDEKARILGLQPEEQVNEAADWLADMNDLGPVAWPPVPIKTERLVLREPEARDRAAFIELHASSEVHTYLGGPRPRDELEREMPEVLGRRPGSFVVDLDGR